MIPKYFTKRLKQWCEWKIAIENNTTPSECSGMLDVLAHEIELAYLAPKYGKLCLVGEVEWIFEKNHWQMWSHTSEECCTVRGIPSSSQSAVPGQITK